MIMNKMPRSASTEGMQPLLTLRADIEGIAGQGKP